MDIKLTNLANKRKTKYVRVLFKKILKEINNYNNTNIATMFDFGTGVNMQ
jgi:hypothetical protein